MDHRQAFLLSLLDEPAEVNRLVFADWLHDQGEDESARRFREAHGPVEVAWAVIHDWLARHHSTMLSLLNGPADEAAIGRLESQIGQTLPEDFKASYRIHNGSDPVSGVLVGLPLMSLEEIGEVWHSWADIAADEGLVAELSEDRESRPPGAVKPLYANRGWVPFVGDSQHHVALDFDPGPKGRPGQVINCGRDDEVLHAIAGDLAGFLTFVARQFVLGRVSRGENEDRDNPRWLKIAGSKRDLLTGLQLLLHPHPRFAEQVGRLAEERRLHFYELLAHNLTVAIRGVWADEAINDTEKVEQIKWINEILHRATARIWVLRLKTQEWADEDFGSMLQSYLCLCEGIKDRVIAAVNRSYRPVAGQDMG